MACEQPLDVVDLLHVSRDALGLRLRDDLLLQTRENERVDAHPHRDLLVIGTAAAAAGREGRRQREHGRHDQRGAASLRDSHHLLLGELTLDTWLTPAVV